ncbi:MAG: IS66 family transposase [Anaerolineales bacterium]|jgi:transposase
MSHKRNKPSQPSTKEQRIGELEEQLTRALAAIEKLKRQNELLHAENEELKRAGKRQAAPFARRKLVEHPKRPGRKAGQGKFSRREQPTHRQVDQTKKAKLHGCPDCGGRLKDIHKHEQYVTDIPETIRLVTTRYVTYSGYCVDCHKRVRSRHPEQTSQATGAAGVLVGPRAKALAADLKHRLPAPVPQVQVGGSYAKVSETLNDAFGMQVSRSGWCQADQRLAKTGRPVYQELIEAMQCSSVVHADETGWRIGTLSAWLWAFTNQEAPVYAIRDNRSSDVVVEILGGKFHGIQASDCFLAYDDKRLKDWLKQKCLLHLLKDLKEMEESKTGRAVQFAQQLTEVLQAALQLKAEKTGLDPGIFAQRAQILETQLDALISRQRNLKDRENVRFARRLRKHRPHLLRCLYMDGLDATNNLAERQLRPGVIIRKTNGCNRSKVGAQTHSVLTSVLVTCRQHSILDYMVSLQQFGKTPPSLIRSP